MKGRKMSISSGRKKDDRERGYGEAGSAEGGRRGGERLE